MKVTVVGAGNVGASCARLLATREVCSQIVLIDIQPGLAEGKALDMCQAFAVQTFDTVISGYTNDYGPTANSDVVVITSGVARKPGMSRDELVATNAAIVQGVTRQIVTYSPHAKLLVASNPLDVMTYLAYRESGMPPSQVFGMAGVLDTARFKSFIASELGVSTKDISALIMGGHGDSMVPLPRFTTVSGIPLNELMTQDKVEQIVRRTIHGGAEIVNHMGTSAWYAPGAALAFMVETLLRGLRKIVPTSAWLNGEYGLSGFYFGVPVYLGRNGVEGIVELQLTNDEAGLVRRSAESVQTTLRTLDAAFAAS